MALVAAGLLSTTHVADKKRSRHHKELRSLNVKLTSTVESSPLAEAGLETADEVEPEAHDETAINKHRTASPSIDVNDCGD